MPKRQVYGDIKQAPRRYTMHSIQTKTVNLSGSNYEIGYGLGKLFNNIPPLKNLHTAGMEGFDGNDVNEAAQMFDRWCPGLNEELKGFADALKVESVKVLYYAMTYLKPRCSHIALLPSLTAEGKPLVARNYEFNHEAEDFCMVKTSVTGKYSHIGTSVLSFGRDDGLNEFGLSVTLSSCGFPVGPLPYMRAPRLKGLQFWAVVRALLENCKNVDEAVAYMKGMPVAYNMNLILADKTGKAALYETLDGKHAYKVIDKDTKEQHLHVTNHAVLPELTVYEPEIMEHSEKRYNYIRENIEGRNNITRDELKNMLLNKYPDGLCCHYFDEYFGTTKSMIISPVDGTVEICWGGREENGWNVYSVNDAMKDGMRQIEISPEKAEQGMFDFIKRV
jgi:predicted choloylglycine hydrolase